MGANPGHGRHTQSIKGKQEKNKYKDDKSPIIESFKLETQYWERRTEQINLFIFPRVKSNCTFIMTVHTNQGDKLLNYCMDKANQQYSDQQQDKQTLGQLKDMVIQLQNPVNRMARNSFKCSNGMSLIQNSSIQKTVHHYNALQFSVNSHTNQC